MKFIKHTLLGATGLLVATTLTCQCKSDKPGKEADWSEARQKMEVRGQQLLGEARSALSRKDFATARARIKALRTDCELAFDARQAGILLLDSIELQEAVDGMVRTDSLLRMQAQPADSLTRQLEEYNQKIKFFRRKITHDKSADQQ